MASIKRNLVPNFFKSLFCVRLYTVDYITVILLLFYFVITATSNITLIIFKIIISG